MHGDFWTKRERGTLRGTSYLYLNALICGLAETMQMSVNLVTSQVYQLLINVNEPSDSSIPDSGKTGKMRVIDLCNLATPNTKHQNANVHGSRAIK